jgi:hypothetical protein
MANRPFVYRQRAARGLLLRLLDLSIGADSYKRVLDSLGVGIRAAINRIDTSADAEEIAEYETEIIENMLGVAYVTCQPQISAVLNAALRIPGHSLTARELLKLGPRFNEEYSMIEVLWELGNYFKHRDQWSRNTWTKPCKREKRTVKVIKAAGLRYGCTGNLRKGAEALGNLSYANVPTFRQLVGDWSEQVRQRIDPKAKP